MVDISVGSRIFQICGSAHPKEWGANLFSKSCMNVKKIGPRASLNPLNPPMSIYILISVKGLIEISW